MAKKPTRLKSKPKSAGRILRTIKPGQVVEDSGMYQSDRSKKRTTLVKGDFAPPTPLKDERWLWVIDMSKAKA